MRTADLLSSSSSPLSKDVWINNLVRTNDISNNNHATLTSTTSNDGLRQFDPTTLQLVASIDRVHDGVACLKPFDADQACVLTAGRDVNVRCWDLRTGKAVLDLADGSKTPYISLDTRGHNVVVGTEWEHAQAAVLIWDSRLTKSPILQYNESHSDDITEIRFHPTIPACLLSGSTDGLLNIYNTSVADEDDALIQVMNHGSSISHAGFLTTTHVYGLSHDENLSVYELETDPEKAASDVSDVPLKVFGDLRPRLNCEYVVDVVASSGPSGCEAIVGAGSHRIAGNQHLDLHVLSSEPDWSFQPENSFRLPGAHGEDVVRAFCFHQPTSTIYTGGEDGLIRAWRTCPEKPLETPSLKTEQARHEDTDKNEKPAKKKRKKTTDGKNRFQPD